MSEVDDFLADVLPRLRVAGIALHRVDARPRKALWSQGIRSPCSAPRRAVPLVGGEPQVRLGGRPLNRMHIVGVVAIERITATASGVPTSYASRATTVFREEGGTWKAVHRHGDPCRQGE